MQWMRARSAAGGGRRWPCPMAARVMPRAAPPALRFAGRQGRYRNALPWICHLVCGPQSSSVQA
eukprot:10110111-Lingulodinium_polyedra.AAC.1